MGVKAARKYVDEIDPRSKFHQNAYAQLLQAQMLCRSTSISPTILRPTLPVHSTNAMWQ